MHCCQHSYSQHTGGRGRFSTELCQDNQGYTKKTSQKTKKAPQDQQVPLKFISCPKLGTLHFFLLVIPLPTTTLGIYT